MPATSCLCLVFRGHCRRTGYTPLGCSASKSSSSETTASEPALYCSALAGSWYLVLTSPILCRAGNHEGVPFLLTAVRNTGMADFQATSSWVMRDAPDKIQNRQSTASLFNVREHVRSIPRSIRGTGLLAEGVGQPRVVALPYGPHGAHCWMQWRQKDCHMQVYVDLACESRTPRTKFGSKTGKSVGRKGEGDRENGIGR
ncbi:uncharacterized protein LY79DRAFT_576582 [Colletotrichum navitas]|uniref:Uncharacterized protein n=1 Tax=Colletotrichum navitas TaxID=681940 RepID=A0AAD8QAJ5_9PEZI|nr:uncharacterized protein LY79DRAFT_576582 [Colletotrichum navitas]KAK1597793.1 hypothetical protein LY79DRAFT_576582 [Colletotrichum navitas]